MASQRPCARTNLTDFGTSLAWKHRHSSRGACAIPCAIPCTIPQLFQCFILMPHFQDSPLAGELIGPHISGDRPGDLQIYPRLQSLIFQPQTRYSCQIATPNSHSDSHSIQVRVIKSWRIHSGLVPHHCCYHHQCNPLNIHGSAQSRPCSNSMQIRSISTKQIHLLIYPPTSFCLKFGVHSLSV